MKLEDAIKELQESLDTLREYDIAHSSRLKQALEIAIKALENHNTFMKYAYSQGKQDALSQEPCTDAVSRDAFITRYREWMKSEYGKIPDDDTLAIRVIKSLPPVTQNPIECDDAISRDAVLNAICDYVALGEFADKSHTFTVRPLEKRIDALPSVTQKSGKWIITPMSNIAYCSECDYLFKDIPASIVEHFKHCPNCGAKMESEG